MMRLRSNLQRYISYERGTPLGDWCFPLEFKVFWRGERNLQRYMCWSMSIKDAHSSGPHPRGCRGCSLSVSLSVCLSLSLSLSLSLYLSISLFVFLPLYLSIYLSSFGI